ncbi:unnamed protein product [Didymodactylos carnosus]|uniref:Uncharacterized protein n=1 Tax=Didymodactylos carnosus TaxID=1234261 RepID=A0A814Z1E9_9BILA|nr:unnamed protein product [Didymodactylos carnosus]CAF3998665.1 unnamed protein product [Didymodactylos carnosus]
MLEQCIQESTCNGSKLLTFDNICYQLSTENFVPNGYGCLHWNEAWYVNTSILSGVSTSAKQSGQYVILNANGTNMQVAVMNNSTDRFDLLSFFANAFQYDGTQLVLTGLRLMTKIYAKNFTLNKTPAATINLNWTNLTTFTYQTYFGSLQGPGYQIVLDNLLVNLYEL